MEKKSVSQDTALESEHMTNAGNLEFWSAVKDWHVWKYWILVINSKLHFNYE